jgi:hypothetical protein
MFDWVFDMWYARQRRKDIEILWPSCRELTSNLDHAKAAFTRHARSDPAWLHLSKEHADRIINALGNSEKT